MSKQGLTEDQHNLEYAALRARIAKLEGILGERQQTEERLFRLSTFPEQNPNIVIETDMTGKVTYLNPVAQARFPDLWTLGYEHPLLKDLQLRIASLQDGGQDFFAREVMVGDAFFEEKICCPSGGDFVRIFAHDITGRKRAEQAVEELAQQRQRLAQRVVSAQEEERRRVSQELHDEAGQALTALKLNLELIRSELPSEEEAVSGNLGEAISLVDETRERIRLLAQGLRPPALDTVGLSLTLEDFCRSFAQRTQLAIEYRGTKLPALADAAEIGLYRFLQEALTNVAKHAKASRVIVEVQSNTEWVSLSVEDNGSGFDRSVEDFDSDLFGGIGLLGMRERLELLGGRVEIKSEAGSGTSLRAYLPLEGAT